MLSQVKGMVMRVLQIEHFFVKQGAEKEYRHFISQLKFLAKADLFWKHKKQWMNTFNEAKWSLLKMSNVFDKRTILKYFIISFLGYFVIPVLKLCKK